MSERDGYPQGVPAWVDVSAADPAAARDFYAGLFGWDYDVAGEEYGGYATAKLGGRSVAGIGGRMEESQPVVWTSYFAVDDADKAVEAVPAAGGQVVMPPMTIGDTGRMALVADPTGAVSGLWQSGSHRGAQRVNEPGTVGWNELATPDLDAALPFYSAVLGVDWADMDTGEPGMVYKLLRVDGKDVGGAMPQDPAQDPSPPHWTVYFVVADTDATAARATELGGRVLLPPMPTPQGPMAVLADPQGGTFAVIASEPN